MLWPHKSSRCPECATKLVYISLEFQPCALSKIIEDIKTERDALKAEVERLQEMLFDELGEDAIPNPGPDALDGKGGE